jgi:hydrogenase-4 component B
LGNAPVETLSLPLGLPWIAGCLRVDAHAAFFLAVVNLGGAAPCLYGLSDGRSEHSSARLLPFFPASLAGMNLVRVAADVHSLLLSWGFMSIAIAFPVTRGL